MKNIYFLFTTVLSLNVAFADAKFVRWTGAEDKNPELGHVLDVVRQKTGLVLSVSDFMPLENRKLANTQFAMYEQIAAGVPIKSQSLRIWTSLETGETVQVEANVDVPPATDMLTSGAFDTELSTRETTKLVTAVAKANTDDPFVRNLEFKDFWKNGVLVREAVAKGKRGKHKVTLSLETKKVLESSYEEFPQSDEAFAPNIPVRVFPIYEEVEERSTPQLLDRVNSELRYLDLKVKRPVTDPYAPLRTVRYQDDMFDPLLGLTVMGRAKGFWASSYIKEQAKNLLGQVAETENGFQNGGVVLSGKYATVSVYPDAVKAFKNLSFTPSMSSNMLFTFQTSATNPDHEEMVPLAALRGRPLTSLDDAWMRVARRLPDHNPESYLNDGFDELQVYWAVTQMFDSLRSMGFTDPDLSTRPFNAFLYNPDISYRDNAFYTDDTINFTTYSPKAANFARHNPTIWHELGHGVMDRLMGDYIQLADTGGLSEGMADFVAQMVLTDVAGEANFPGKFDQRIFNQTGFLLTNEVHDDGEAYGGSMNDILRFAIARFGRKGLEKVTNLTLETMRLTRNHPHLTAGDWFEHMVFADSLGSRGVREQGELKDLIMRALNGRNFVFNGGTPAKFTMRNGTEEVTATGPGSRPKPIKHTLKETETASYKLEVNLQNSPTYNFKFPVTVKVSLRGGPLQGGIQWVDEDKTPFVYTLANETDKVTIPLTAKGVCDEINRPDNSCVDYAYVQIWNNGETVKPQAKKRFYLRVYPSK